MLEERLNQLNIKLPTPAKPLAAYVGARKSGGLIYTSGQLPLKEGKLLMTGPLGQGIDLTQALAAMEICFLNGLAAASLTVPLNNIIGVLRLTAFVASAPGFYEQHLVANGASELAQKIFGEAGMHARSAVGVISLPLNSSVEIEIIFECESE